MLQPARRSRFNNRQRSGQSPRRLKVLEIRKRPPTSVVGPVATVSATAETSTTLENEKFRITFSNKGAQVEHWILKGSVDSSGKPLDMVQQEAASRFGLPLSLFTYDNSLTKQLNSALYQPSATGQLLAPNSVTFHYAAGGLDVVKTFSFDTSYVVSVHVNVKQNGVPVRALVAWPAGLGDMEEFSLRRQGGRSSSPRSRS